MLAGMLRIKEVDQHLVNLATDEENILHVKSAINPIIIFNLSIVFLEITMF